MTSLFDDVFSSTLLIALSILCLVWNKISFFTWFHGFFIWHNSKSERRKEITSCLFWSWMWRHLGGEFKSMQLFFYVETDAQNLRLINGRFTTNFIIFFANYILKYLSQNWDSDSHFEVLNWSKSQLVQKLWHKTQIFTFPGLCNFVERFSFL